MTDRLGPYMLLTAAADALRAERDRLIVDLWRAGYGVTVIAREAGLTRRAIYDILGRDPNSGLHPEEGQ